jgi:hypothetical protein
MMQTTERLGFVCPRCGSSAFGTSFPENEGCCHGDGCRFTWNRDDDWKYFQHVVRTVFENNKEFEEESIRLHKQPGAGTVAS